MNLRLTILFTFLWALTTWAQPNITLNNVASGLNNPVDIANAGDGRLFIVEQGGFIRILDTTGNIRPTPFFFRSVTSGGERGLLGLEFDPDYANNGYFYVYYSLGSNSVVSRYEVMSSNPNVANMTSEQVIMTIPQPFSNHNGGDIAFGKDGYLYIGLGDGGSGGDPGNRSQNLQTLLGKMLRIDVSSLPYTIPPTNPFVNDPGVLDEIWSIGLRNPWRWSFDRLTGDLWIADVGQGAREEIHYTPYDTVGGTNYGWRCYEGNLSFNTNGCQMASNYEFPVYDYPRNLGQSVTGGFVYRGIKSQKLKGMYFFGDYNTGRLFGTISDTLNPGNWITQQLLNTSNQWSTFGEDANGEVYAADYNSGNIFRIDGPCANFKASANISSPTCNAAQDGQINLNVNGANGNTQVSWSTGSSNASINNLSAGSYTYTITDDEGCVLSATLQLDIVPLEAAEISSMGALSICTGDSVTLIAPTPPSGYSYQWLKDGLPIAGATDNLLVTKESGSYQLETNGVCTVPVSEEKIVTVDTIVPTPIINIQGILDICAGTSGTLRSSVAPQNYTYQWFLNGNPIAGATNQEYTTSQPGNYSVQHLGACPTSNSVEVEAIIRALPEANITQIGDSLFASEGVEYQWSLNGSILFGASSQSLPISDTGTYEVVVTNEFGCQQTSDPFQVVPTGIDTWIMGGDAQLIPNPAQDIFKLQLNLLQISPLSIRLMDMQGRTIEMRNLNPQKGKIVETFSMKDQVDGLYQVQVLGSDFQVVKTLIILH